MDKMEIRDRGGEGQGMSRYTQDLMHYTKTLTP